MTTPCKCAVASVTNGINETAPMIQCEGRKDGSCRLMHKAMTTPTPDKFGWKASLERLAKSSIVGGDARRAMEEIGRLERDLAAAQAELAQERDQWTSPKTVHAIAQHLKGYQPFSDENVRVMLDDISNGIEDRAAAIRRGEE